MNTAQILSEMGIDVWRLRTDGLQQEVLDAAASESASGPQAVVESPGSRGQTAAAVESNARTAAPATEAPVEAPVEGKPVAPFNVVSLADEGGLLLFQSADLKSARRFAVDLLAAVTGSWSRNFRQLVFAWPQPGIENTHASMVKALAAFVDKQIHDAGSNRVLVSAELLQSLDQSWPDVEIQPLPEIDRLMVDAELKKSAWLEISKRWRL